MKITRRTAIALTAHSLALAAVASAAPAAKSRRFKIGACEWSLRKSDPSCFALAREIGLDGVQVDLGNVRNKLHLREPGTQQAYMEAAKKSQVEIASLATAEFNNVALKSEPRAAIWLLDSITAARALGVRIVLIAQFFLFAQFAL